MQGGGGAVWDGMAYDPDLNLIYVGTGNGPPKAINAAAESVESPRIISTRLQSSR